MTESENILQFIKYVIGGCIATATHIIVFHITAWKIFPALQKSDWFVRSFDLAVQDIDDRTRSRNSVKSNAVAFLVSNMVAYLINIFWVFVPGRYHWLILFGIRNCDGYRYVGNGFAHSSIRHINNLCLRVECCDSGADQLFHA